MQRTRLEAPSGPRKSAGIAAAGLVLSVLLAAGCDMAERRHGAAEQASAPSVPASRSETGVAAEVPPSKVQNGRCVTPRAEPAPAVAAAAAQCPADPAQPLALPTGQVRFPDAPSAPRVTVERALDDPARARGLMYRTELGADAGMLFSWNEEERRSFWMLNTCIPLDMLFIAGDGTIVGILEQVPTLNTLPRGVPCPAQHVLEVNAGWARQHGVEPGQRVELET